MEDAKVILFHDGCAACLEMSDLFGRLLASHSTFEIVNLRTERHRLRDAQAAGVKTLPSLAKSDCVVPLEFHADLDLFLGLN